MSYRTGATCQGGRAFIYLCHTEETFHSKRCAAAASPAQRSGPCCTCAPNTAKKSRFALPTNVMPHGSSRTPPPRHTHCKLSREHWSTAINALGIGMFASSQQSSASNSLRPNSDESQCCSSNQRLGHRKMGPVSGPRYLPRGQRSPFLVAPLSATHGRRSLKMSAGVAS